MGLSRVWMGFVAATLVSIWPFGAGAIEPGGFDAADGNLIVDALPPPPADVKDWENLHLFGITPQVGFDMPVGATDNSFGQGTKSDTPVPTIVDGSIPRNKSDFDRFYVASELVPDTSGDEKVMFYVAWIRNNTLGSANFNVELNQSELISANGQTPIRTANDVLITFDFASGGNQVEIGLLRWIDATGDVTACFASNALPCWGHFASLTDPALPVEVAEGSVNFGRTVYDPIAGVDILDSRFGEAAINMTDTGILSPDACSGFATAYVTSRSSDSFTSAVKDFIAPIDAPFDLCGELTIRKFDDDTVSLDDAVFYLYAADGPADTDPTDDVAGLPLASCTIEGGSCTFQELGAGSYWVVEVEGVPGYCLPDPAYRRVDLALREEVTVDFVNFRRFTVITLVCQGDQLFAAQVTLDGVTRTSLVDPALGATLCGLGGARFPDLTAGLHPGQVAIGSDQPCVDGLDNDGDTLVDGDDPTECVVAPECTAEACDNAIDDDGDLLVDAADPDCAP